MRWRMLLDRCRALLHAQRVHDEIDEELEFHIDMRAREYERQGMSAEAAQAAARRSFGSMTRIKEVSYDVRGGGWIETVWRDVVYAARVLRGRPTFSGIIVAVIAIGIGANAAILGVADHVLWRELPVRAPSELVQLSMVNIRPSGANYMPDFPAFSYPMLRALRTSGAFADVLARWRQSSTFTDGETNERHVLELVSGNYFDMLGITPEAGRLVSVHDDETIMGNPVVVISDRYWRSRFSADPAIIGRTIRIDDYPLTVIGVAPRKFTGIEVGVFPDAWVPLAMHPAFFSARRSLADDPWMWLDLVGRPQYGASVALTRARATIAIRHFADAQGWPPSFKQNMRLTPASRGITTLRDLIGPSLLVLLGVAGLVLLIACANVATLLVVRSMARQREIGVRMALGASRLRVVRQLCVESLLLAIAGGVVGSVFAVRGAQALIDFVPPAALPTELNLTPDARALTISFVLATVTGLLFGVAPAIVASRVDPATVIRDDTRLRRLSRWKLGARRTIVAAQIALSVVLIVGAGLFTRTVAKLAAVPMGFDVNHVLMATIAPSQNRYNLTSADIFYSSLEARLAAVPGIQAVGSAVEPLLGGESRYNFRTVRTPERMTPPGGPTVFVHTVTPGFFAAIGLEVLHGRALTASDGLGAPLVTVFNEAAAHKYFDDANPVGRQVLFSVTDRPTVVGVVRDAKYRTMREEPPPTVYTTFAQDSDMVSSMNRTLYVRGSLTATELAAAVRSAAHDLDPSVPVYGVKTLAEQKDSAMSNERVVALLSALAGGIALLLAAIGLYGVIVFDMQRRTHEMGVRVSLGASKRDIAALALRGTTITVIVGLFTGIAISRLVSHLVAAELFGVSTNDPFVVAVACVTLTVVAFLAALLPAWRATNVSPLEALRCE